MRVQSICESGKIRNHKAYWRDLEERLLRLVWNCVLGGISEAGSGCELKRFGYLHAVWKIQRGALTIDGISYLEVFMLLEVAVNWKD